ncbi:PaeR7I family type II restriction endonuclease [Archangium sp.]|uniref:PaeR7I family type II restriction endonuclease n=1 Tax=Archangium sp. TaxID=1872627 RepID=UPI00286B562D|nr:PaeR7I family type II restriction endonuclease [Archangium sp.]
MSVTLTDYENRTRKAVAHYWKTLSEQSARQAKGDADRGRRSAVTGGKQMDGFCRLVNQLLIDNGLPEAHIYTSTKLELPGYFRPTKKWDMVVVYKDMLVAALEFKSQRGPSFGNNFNNRSEEAIGTGKDIETAFREKAFGASPRPWLGWLMLLEDCPASKRPVKVDEPHFEVFPEFWDTSYAQRYELLLRKLVLEKLFDSSALLMCTEAQGQIGDYTEPARDLGVKQFLAGLGAHVGKFLASL